jgi:hypothetical protein
MNNVYKNINIVEEAYLEIEKKQLINDIPHIEQIIFSPFFETVSTEEKTDFSQNIINEINYLRRHASVEFYRSLSIYKNKNLFSLITLFIKKVIRKLIKFIIFPIVSDQNNFNVRLINALEFFENSLRDKDKQIQELREELKSKIQ